MAKLRRGGTVQQRRMLSPWSARGFSELDGRLLEAKEEKRIIRELSEHVGKPTITQVILIRRAARLLIMIGQLERQLIEGNSMGDLAARQICALHNSLRLSLQAIGLAKASDQLPALKNYLKAV